MVIPVTTDGERATRAGQDPGWWRRAVVYQIYPRSFADANGDGFGDLRGIIDKLDYLAELGVDVLWLSPIYASPQVDNGYDISDYQAVDPAFGTLDDFDELVREAHRRDLRIMMDLVVNHTSDQHPWFVESRQPGSGRRDWYWWRPARDGMAAGTPGAEPNNWGSFFSGSAWQFDEASGEYFLHLFAAGQPDLNWENPQVRQAIYAMMRWWLDRGVDGFRMDVINMISKDPALPDGRNLSAGVGGYADGGASYLCGPRIHEFLQEMNRAVFTGRDQVLLTVGEMPGVTVAEAALFTDPTRREVDMVFQFEHVGLDHGATKWDPEPLSLTALKASLGRWQAGLAQVGWNSLYWDNHDQPRVVSRFGDDGEYRVQSAKMLATVLHLHRGTPYVYQGEELGMTNVPMNSVADLHDVEALNHFLEATKAGEPADRIWAGLRASSRDNARSPMQWDASPQSGFTAGTPWFPVNPNHVAINAADQRRDPDSVFAHYQWLVDFRHRHEVVVDGDFTMLLPEDHHIYAFTRRLGGVVLLVLGNFSADEQPIGALDDATDWGSSDAVTLLRGNYPAPEARLEPLRPWETRVLMAGG